MKIKKNFFLFLILLILLDSCAKNPQKPLRMNIVQSYPTLSSITDFDLTNKTIFVAEEQIGLAIFNEESTELIRRIDRNDPYLNSITNLSTVSYYEPEHKLFIADRSNSSLQKIFIFDYYQDTQILAENSDALTGGTATVHDIVFTHNIEQDATFYVFWGYMSSGTYYLRKNLYHSINNSITTISITPIQNIAQRIYLSQDYLAIAMGQYGVAIYDHNLQLLLTISTPSFAIDVLMLNNYLLVADRNDAVLIYDLKNLNNYFLANRINLQGQPVSFSSTNNYLAVGTPSNGIYLYNIKDCLEPKFIDRIPFSLVGPISRLKFYQNDLYAACRNVGLIKIKIK